MIVGVDLVEDAGVEDTSGRDRARRPCGQQGDAVVGDVVQLPGPLDLEGIRSRHAGVDPAGPRVGAETAEVLLWDVDAAAVEVLADVAEEVGELERAAQVAGRSEDGRRPTGSRMGSIISPITAADPSM